MTFLSGGPYIPNLVLICHHQREINLGLVQMKAQTSKKIKESKSAIVEITSTSDEDLVASVDKSVKRKKPQLNPVASLNSVSTSNRGSKKLKIEDDDLFHKVDHDIDIAKRIRTPSAKAKAAESVAADSGDSDHPLTALQSKVSKDFLAESSHVATPPPSSKKKGKAKVNESIFEADNTREDHSATSYKVKLELAEVILDGKKKRTIHFSDSEAEGNIDKEENTLPNTETVNGSDEINYLDDIQGVETDHTLALMPVELRDLRLMDDYLKLPRVNLKETLMLPFSEQEIICDSFSTLYNGLAHNDNYIRLFNSAVKFRFSLPFINPARSPANLISIDYSKYVLTSTSNKLLRGNNAVFMMTGHVTECALVNPVPSFEGNSFFGSAPGPLVKRIRLRCIAVEYERLCAYIGSALHFKGNRGFVGPTSAGGIVLATKKLGAAQGATASGPSTPKSRRFLASSPSKSRFGDVNTAKQSGDSFPASLLLEQDVPIYDARGVESFDFSDYNLKHIEDLPHFKEGREDLSPEKYIATTLMWRMGTEEVVYTLVYKNWLKCINNTSSNFYALYNSLFYMACSGTNTRKTSKVLNRRSPTSSVYFVRKIIGSFAYAESPPSWASSCRQLKLMMICLPVLSSGVAAQIQATKHILLTGYSPPLALLPHLPLRLSLYQGAK
ncbi:hypothetical protein JOM56_015383 [Amanita muscaria]